MAPQPWPRARAARTRRRGAPPAWRARPAPPAGPPTAPAACHSPCCATRSVLHLVTIMYRISTAHMADKQDAMFVSGIFRMRSMHSRWGRARRCGGGALHGMLGLPRANFLSSFSASQGRGFSPSPRNYHVGQAGGPAACPRRPQHVAARPARHAARLTPSNSAERTWCRCGAR